MNRYFDLKYYILVSYVIINSAVFVYLMIRLIAEKIWEHKLFKESKKDKKNLR